MSSRAEATFDHADKATRAVIAHHFFPAYPAMFLPVPEVLPIPQGFSPVRLPFTNPILSSSVHRFHASYYYFPTHFTDHLVVVK